jgi:serine/threonine protein kinase
MTTYDMKCFVDEFEFLSQINHPHIVRVFDLKEDDKAVYLIMEYLNGSTLASQLEQVVSENDGLGFSEEHAQEIFLK